MYVSQCGVSRGEFVILERLELRKWPQFPEDYICKRFKVKRSTFFAGISSLNEVFSLTELTMELYY